MISYANQKIYTLNKVENPRTYGIFCKESMFLASRQLSPKAFNLWCYMNSNQDGVTLALSMKDYINKMGSNKSSYNRSVTELIKLGYLVKEKGNKYIFIEKVVLQNEDILTEDTSSTQREDDNMLTENIEIIQYNTRDSTEGVASLQTADANQPTKSKEKKKSEKKKELTIDDIPSETKKIIIECFTERRPYSYTRKYIDKQYYDYIAMVIDAYKDSQSVPDKTIQNSHQEKVSKEDMLEIVYGYVDTIGEYDEGNDAVYTKDDAINDMFTFYNFYENTQEEVIKIFDDLLNQEEVS